jgi:hypothetical protein
MRPTRFIKSPLVRKLCSTNWNALPKVVPRTVCVRDFSSPANKDDDSLKSKSQAASLLSRYAYPAAAAGGTFVAAMLMYDVAYDFLVLTPAQSMYYGYLAGMMTAGIGGGVSFLGFRWSRLNPDRAISAAMKALNKDPLAKEILGTGISAGSVRAYKIRRGFLSFEGIIPKFARPEVQLVFIAKGSNKEAIATVTYSVLAFREHVAFCGLSWVNPRGLPEAATIVCNHTAFTATEELKSLSKRIFSL